MRLYLLRKVIFPALLVAICAGKFQDNSDNIHTHKHSIPPNKHTASEPLNLFINLTAVLCTPFSQQINRHIHSLQQWCLLLGGFGSLFLVELTEVRVCLETMLKKSIVNFIMRILVIWELLYTVSVSSWEHSMLERTGGQKATDGQALLLVWGFNSGIISSSIFILMQLGRQFVGK